MNTGWFTRVPATIAPSVQWSTSTVLVMLMGGLPRVGETNFSTPKPNVLTMKLSSIQRTKPIAWPTFAHHLCHR
jgi:hypothetical protein